MPVPKEIAEPAEPAEPTSKAWTPLLDASERAAVSRVPARHPFLLMSHRERWGVLRGKVRPILGRMKLTPGVSNVSVGPGGSTRIGVAKAHYEERGWTILPATTLPPKQAARGSYLTRPNGRPDVALLYWEEAFPGSASLRCDEELQDEFLDYVCKSGLVPPPPIHVLERLRDEAAQEHASCADRSATVPSYKPLATAALERLAVLEAEVKKRRGKIRPVQSSPLPVEEEA